MRYRAPARPANHGADPECDEWLTTVIDRRPPARVSLLSWSAPLSIRCPSEAPGRQQPDEYTHRHSHSQPTPHPARTPGFGRFPSRPAEPCALFPRSESEHFGLGHLRTGPWPPPQVVIDEAEVLIATTAASVTRPDSPPRTRKRPRARRYPVQGIERHRRRPSIGAIGNANSAF